MPPKSGPSFSRASYGRSRSFLFFHGIIKESPDEWNYYIHGEIGLPESGVLNRQLPGVIKVPKKRTKDEITILILTGLKIFQNLTWKSKNSGTSVYHKNIFLYLLVCWGYRIKWFPTGFSFPILDKNENNPPNKSLNV